MESIGRERSRDVVLATLVMAGKGSSSVYACTGIDEADRLCG
jgi:hypothetical protein